MSVKYQTVVMWDDSLRDLELVDSSAMPLDLRGLCKHAIKITTGAPDAGLHAGKFIRGAQIVNAITSVWYKNTGTTASPTWTVV